MELMVELSVRDLEFDDLGGLDWSGGTTHLEALAEAVGLRLSGEAGLLIVTVGAGGAERSVACGAVDYRRRPDAGELWMLSVHPVWQSLGVGTALIGELERRVAGRGHPFATISVEHDNPRALTLYRRLGYSPTGSALDSWAVGGGRRYVTVCTTLEKKLEKPLGRQLGERLAGPDHPDREPGFLDSGS